MHKEICFLVQEITLLLSSIIFVVLLVEILCKVNTISDHFVQLGSSFNSIAHQESRKQSNQHGKKATKNSQEATKSKNKKVINFEESEEASTAEEASYSGKTSPSRHSPSDLKQRGIKFNRAPGTDPAILESCVLDIESGDYVISNDEYHEIQDSERLSKSPGDEFHPLYNMEDQEDLSQPSKYHHLYNKNPVWG